MVRDAIDLAEDQEDWSNLLRALAVATDCLGRLGDVESGRELMLRAAEVAARVTEHSALMLYREARGLHLMDVGEYEAAEAAMLDSLAHCRSEGEPGALATALGNLSELA